MERKSRGIRSWAAPKVWDLPGEGSVVVIDPKSEIAALHGNRRRKGPGAANVKLLNPYGVLVDKGPDLKSVARGDALVKRDSNEHQKHLPDSPRRRRRS